ncbi:hypothetical protein ACOMHN_041968 [Nucella lapillus]
MEDITEAMTPSSFTEAWNTTSAMAHSSFTEAWNTTSARPGNREPFDFVAWEFFQTTRRMQFIVPPIIFSLGTIGNVMTIIIMRRLMSKDSTINIYFTAIAGVDLLYLWTIVLHQTILYNLEYDFRIIHGVFCKMFTWLYTAGGTVSCWYLVCMTVHRAMSVVWPHRVNVLCTQRTVLIMLSAVTVIIALLYCHYLVGYDIVITDNGATKRCTLGSQDYKNFSSNVFVYIETLVYSAVPFIMIVVANTIMTWKLVASARRADRSLTKGSSKSQARSREKEANSVTLTMMAVSLTFLVLTLPSTANFIVNHLTYAQNSQLPLGEMFWKISTTSVCNLLGFLNHAVNFYLYCLTGRRFREEFLKVLCCGRGGRRLRALSG